MIVNRDDDIINYKEDNDRKWLSIDKITQQQTVAIIVSSIIVGRERFLWPRLTLLALL